MWFRSEEDIDVLIAKGKLDKAASQLREKLAKDPKSTSLRQLLGDVLGRSGQNQEAVAILAPLVNDFTRQGFSTKAIAVVKKIERLDPTRQDINRLIERVRVEANQPLAEEPKLIRGFEARPVTTGVSPSGFRPTTSTGQPPRRDVPMATSKLERDWLSKVERRSDFHWSPLLNHLSQEDLASTVGRLNLITKHSGSIIYGQGEVAESLFILATGFARAFDRSEGSYRQVAVFEEGQFLGEEAFLAEDRQRCVTVTAASDCELLEIDMPTLRQILLEQHAVLEQLEGVFRCRPWVTSGSRVGA